MVAQKSQERCYCVVCKIQRVVLQIDRGYYKCRGCQTVGLVQIQQTGKIFVPEIRKDKLEKLQGLERSQS